MKNILVILFVLSLLAGCATNQAPQPDSDSGQRFMLADGGIPVDDNVYVIEGKVVAGIENISTINARGSVGGYSSGGAGYVSGSYAVWQEGKGFVRLTVVSISPSLSFIKPGMTVIVKTTDQKVMALLPEDQVVFKCRAQYESVAAVRENETFDSEKLETWEIDYCRMETPQISE